MRTGLIAFVSSSAVRRVLRYLSGVLGVILLLTAQRERAWAQHILERCEQHDLPTSRAVLDSILLEPFPPRDLEVLLFEETRTQAHPPKMQQVVERAVRRFGAPSVARALLELIHTGRPYLGSTGNRRNAAVTYGLLHRLYAESAPITPFAAMLSNPRYPDEVKTGLAVAIRETQSGDMEILHALDTVLCQTMSHVRPFVIDRSDLLIPGAKRRLLWYNSAVVLLYNLVKALAVLPEGLEAIDRHVRDEKNEVLADAIRSWAGQESSMP